MLDRGDHSSHVVDLLKVVSSALREIAGQTFEEVRAGERVDVVGDAALVRDDLLSPEGQQRRLARRERERFVEGVGVERVRSAEHRTQRLDRGPGDVVVGLLRRERDACRLRVEA